MNSSRHSFTEKSNGIRNRLVSKCWTYKAWTPEDDLPQPPRVQYDALWDTGAMQSMVTQRVVDDLGLRAQSYTKVFHVGGSSIDVPQYYVNLVVVSDFHIPYLQVVHGRFPGIDVIIGMDIINRGDFAVSNRNGATSFSFRIPSIADFDFVKDDEAEGR